MTCSSGHESEWEDYCSVCGESLSPVGTPPGSPATGPDSAADPEATTCPNCAEATAASDVFCEACGYEFLSGTLPDSTQPGASSTAPPAAEPGQWVAIVSVDVDFFERMQFAGVEPPSSTPDPVRIDLPPTDILVGRHSESRGTFPEVDLGGIFEAEGATDPAVSSNHCRLHRGATGWTVTDLGSTNGTFLADETDPLTPGTAMSLLPGTPIHVGAWTRIELVEVS